MPLNPQFGRYYHKWKWVFKFIYFTTIYIFIFSIFYWFFVTWFILKTALLCRIIPLWIFYEFLSVYYFKLKFTGIVLQNSATVFCFIYFYHLANPFVIDSIHSILFIVILSLCYLLFSSLWSNLLCIANTTHSCPLFSHSIITPTWIN